MKLGNGLTRALGWRHLSAFRRCLVLVVIFKGTAHAALVAAAPVQPEQDEAAARVLFREARVFAERGEYAMACPRFEASFRLDPGMGTSFNLADCLEHIGRTASAWARFLDVAETTKAAGQLERERTARARAAELEPLLSRLTIEIEKPAAGLMVRRDGITIGEALWGVAVPLDPGVH